MLIPLTLSCQIRVNKEKKGKMARRKTYPLNFAEMNWYQKFIRNDY